MGFTNGKLWQNIPQHRTAETTLHLRSLHGEIIANTTVTIRQTRHQFLFGCNIFELKPADTSERQLAYQQQFCALLNYATLPFYWGSYEATLGQPDEIRLRTMAAWCQEHRITTKGHPLLWHSVPPVWQSEKSLDDMLRLQMARIEREVSHFRGIIDIWDVANEAVVMPGFKLAPNHMTPLVQQYGVVPLLKEAFSIARQANPQATLLLNDYIQTEEYAHLIEECLDAGVEIDVIGIQSHMHLGYSGNESIWEVCERFARFGKPLHWTEATIISGDYRKLDFQTRQVEWPTTPDGEARQAEEVVNFYTTLFSHPAVHAITWWDFMDGAWLNAPAGLLRADMSPKLAYRTTTALSSR